MSFYQDAISDESNHGKTKTFHAGSMIERIADLSAALCQIYQTGRYIVQAEAARVLGNMTRSAIARNAVHSAGGLKLLVGNLSSDDFDVIGSSCGVLVNLLSDWERRAPFRELKGPLLLRDILQRGVVNRDWLLASIACQVSDGVLSKIRHSTDFRRFQRLCGIISSTPVTSSLHWAKKKPITFQHICTNIWVS